MERMDRFRRVGGWVWVAAGMLAQLVAGLVGWARPGVVTWVLVADIVVLALVLAVSRHGRVAIVVGWITAVLLAADFAAAVVDRFGLFGPPGAPGVSWGSWAAFRVYTADLLHHPGVMITTIAAVAATAVEIVLAVLLLCGWQRRWVGKATAGLFVIYTVALAAGPVPAEVARYAMPVLVGGALLLSSAPMRRRAPEPPPGPDRASSSGAPAHPAVA